MCWTDCADAQADLRLSCSHMAKTGFHMTWLNYELAYMKRILTKYANSASEQSHQRIRCSHIQFKELDEASDKEPHLWPRCACAFKWLRSLFSRDGSYEPHHNKTCFCRLRTTKAQISLRIRAFRSAPLLFAALIAYLWFLYPKFQGST